MAGIYIHIPFCRTRCSYCDFCSVAVGKTRGEREDYVEALCQELQERKTYLQGHSIETIYFGGGTPSQLSAKHFEKIFETLAAVYPALAPCEITLEANPDDLTPEYLDSLKKLPFNRISLGVQSLNDAELRFLNRRHDASSAVRAVRLCREKGFENISIDLMYGLPNQTLKSWQSTLRQAVGLDVQHLSAYHLTYEEGTPLFDRLQQEIVHSIDEDLSVALFETLIDVLTGAGFEQYEISNFARSGYSSRHNSGYWNGAPYLGIGASAHSYNGESRQWNKKIPGAEYKTYGIEMEILDEKALFNDFIITRLRTMKGIDLRELQTLFGEQKKACCLQQANKHLSNQLLKIKNSHLQLTQKGIFVSDRIMSDLLL
ncbi:MAG: radical SAM family heme chaperone HemW [Dysgonamonadaceae bacterium]|jgi:oxygen-independent coproporphyrinogen-3 oxidase|nr:radical SAM family heme chaperone HemW [Dysgonamonadaceae bacterium]